MLIITSVIERYLSVPGWKESFGMVQMAQAGGGMKVLAKRGRRVLPVHLKAGDGGMSTFEAAILAAVKS